MEKAHTRHALKIAVGITMLVLLLASAGGAAPTEQWNRTFGGLKWDWGNSIEITSDGGYLLNGITNSYGAGNSDGWLIKTDESGNELWNKTFGGILDDSGTKLDPTSDGNYLIFATTNSFGAGNIDGWLIKIDMNGNELLNKTYGGIGTDVIRSIQQTSDGGYLLTGYTYSYGAGNSDGWLIKIDESYNEQWNKTFGGSGNEFLKSIQQTSDGGYLLTGYTYSYGFGGQDGWLIKIDESYNEQWNKTFGGTSNDETCCPIQTSDGGYILFGLTYSYGAGNMDVWLVKTDENYNEQWNKTFGGPFYDNAGRPMQTPDGGYMLSGQTCSNEYIDCDAWLIKIDKSYNEQWNKTFGGMGMEATYSRQRTSDGGYILLGSTNSYGAGEYDFWLIKFSSDYPVHNINQSTDYSSIQSAIDDADQGDEIHVDSGTYNENVNVNKQLILKGVDTGGGMPVVDAGGSGVAIIITADSITLEGLNATNSSSISEAGIKVSSNNNIIINNTASNNYGGISLYEASNNILISNNVSNNTHGIRLSSSSNNILIGNNVSNNIGQGIILSQSSNNTINGNNAYSNNYIGISLYEASNNTLNGNIVNRGNIEFSVNRGIYLESSVNNTLRGNNALNYAYGIFIHSSSNNTLSSNNANSNYFEGISLYDSSNNTLSSNNANSNYFDGISVYDASNNTLISNNASNNNYGIVLGRLDGQLAGNNNTLIGNNASNNVDGIRLFYSSNNILIGNTANSNDNVGIFPLSSSNNTLSGSNVSGNLYGIYLRDSSNNNIYNNYFQNNNNFGIDGINSNNFLNTSKNIGNNIIGGSYLGCNFWANPSGTGFSQICINTDGDGICDSAYVLDENNTDYLPLTSLNTILPAGRYINGTVKDNSTGNSLPGVRVSANSTLSTTSNATGFYSFAVNNGTYDLTATYDIRYYTNITTVSTIGQAVVWQDIELMKKPTGNITGSVTRCCT